MCCVEAFKFSQVKKKTLFSVPFLPLFYLIDGTQLLDRTFLNTHLSFLAVLLAIELTYSVTSLCCVVCVCARACELYVACILANVIIGYMLIIIQRDATQSSIFIIL